MRAYQKIFGLLFFALTLSYFSCSQKSKVKERGKIDTLVIEVPVPQAMKDSIYNVYHDSAKAGEREFNPQKLVIRIYPKGYTSDYVGLYTSQQITTLDSIISRYEEQTTNEIAIITIDTLWTTAGQFDAFVLKIHNTWGVGKKEKNNGVVIGICPGYRKIRISTGRGLEQKLTDDEAKKIIDEIVIPAFRNGAYFEGTRQALTAIMNEIR